MPKTPAQKAREMRRRKRRRDERRALEGIDGSTPHVFMRGDLDPGYCVCGRREHDPYHVVKT